jgi:hypothetical protein
MCLGLGAGVVPRLTIEGTPQRSWPVKKRVRPHRSGRGPYRRPTAPSRGNAGRSLIAVEKILTPNLAAYSRDDWDVVGHGFKRDHMLFSVDDDRVISCKSIFSCVGSEDLRRRPLDPQSDIG